MQHLEHAVNYSRHGSRRDTYQIKPNLDMYGFQRNAKLINVCNLSEVLKRFLFHEAIVLGINLLEETVLL